MRTYGRIGPMAFKKLTVKDGKFYNEEDKVVPIEHGNKDQIETLKAVSEMQDGFYPEVDIRRIITMQFTCACGITNDFDGFSEIYVDDPDNVIDGQVDKCRSCGMKYKVFFDEQDTPMLKMIK